MSHSRPLLIPWLREQIDSGSYPGVHWTNQERTEFCIPWKHGLRQDSSDADVLIFKAWAKASGNGRIQGDASIWKRNFRSALRSKGFKTVDDQKGDAANPHKVFRWPEESASAGNSSGGSQDQGDSEPFPPRPPSVPAGQVVPSNEDFLPVEEELFYPAADVSEDILQECLKELDIGPPVEAAGGAGTPPEQQRRPDLVGAYVLPGQQQYPVAFEAAVGEAWSPEQPAHPITGAAGESEEKQLMTEFLDVINKTKDGEHFRTHFRISVFYRGLKVSETLVENEAGFRLVYRPELAAPILDPESGLTTVSLPAVGDMLDQTQARLTRSILENLGGGVDVRVLGLEIFGQRRGDVRAFWSFSNFDGSRRPREISKAPPQRLHNLKDFIQGILEFIDGKECGPCSLFLCLGEKWPDPGGRPWVKKLVTVEVVFTSLELIKNMAVEGGASSLRSVDLQMSLEEMMELC